MAGVAQILPIKPAKGSITGVSMSENDTHISCPYCSEEISASAKKCKHCGEFIDAAMREIEALKNQKQSVFMNADGGASSSSSSAAASGGATEPQLRPYSHWWHLLLTVLTAGLWLPVWILLYLFRNKRVYY